MKGIVFTEFLEMVEERFGLETVDLIITESNLESEGIYTSVGTYSFVEMQALLGSLSTNKNIPVNDLIYMYGGHFFKALTQHYLDVFNTYNDPMELVASIENHIHVQVKKIYPDAELPTFTILKHTEGYLEMLYTSERGMYMFAKALMEKTFEFYEREVSIQFEKLNENGTQVKFMISSHED